MNTLIWLFSLLLASPNVGYNQQTGSNLNSIEPNIEIKYERMFQTNDGIDNGLYLRFSTAFNYNNHLFHQYEQKLDDCKFVCTTLDSCRGVYYFIYYNVSICYGLKDLGDSIVTETPNWSLKKIVHHKYNNDNHSIDGYVHYDDNYHSNSIVYLDENHNGKLDDFEPQIITDDEGYFKFTNLSRGNYIVSEETPDECRQITPGKFGSKRNLDMEVNEFADVVMEYYDNN